MSNGPTPGNRERGFFKVYRCMFDQDDPLWRAKRPRTEFEARLDLLRMVHYHAQPAEVVVQGAVVRVRRGEVLASQRTLAQRWRWDRGKVRRFLAKLEALGTVETVPPAEGVIRTCSKTDPPNDPPNDPPCTHLRFCNWTTYNEAPPKTDPPNDPPNDPGTRRSNKDQEPERTQTTSPSASSDDPPEAARPPYKQVLAAWNELAARSGLPTARKLTEKRRRALKARWRDHDWRHSWRKALDMIPSCPFLVSDNGGSWVANLDWLLRPDSVTKIVEGRYLDRTGAKDRQDDLVGDLIHDDDE